MSRNAESHFAVNPTRIDMSRSRFDRSSSYKTTFNVGQIIPFYVDEVLPGDTFSIDTSKVVRMQTLLTPVMDDIFLDTYYFFVPNRLTWSHWKQFMGENTDSAWIPSVEYEVPQLTAPEGGWNIGTIADYMGIPTGVSGLSVNALPFRAYALIINEWFRDENLSDPLNIPVTDATVQGVNTGTFVTDVAKGGLPYTAAKYHDYFTSALPAPQKGPDVTIPVAEAATAYVYPAATLNPDLASRFHELQWVQSNGQILSQKTPNAVLQLGFTKRAGASESIDSDVTRVISETMQSPPSGNTSLIPGNLVADFSGTSQVATIRQLRLAFQIQKLYERDARGGTRYIEILKSHFGVTSPDARLQRPEYLGGNRIGVMVARYRHTYQQGLERFWSRKDRFDYYFPVFANIGEQAIKNKEIYAQGTEKDDEVFGYQEAWADYRYRPNRVTGEMRSSAPQSLDVWHLGDDYESLPSLSDSWIREDSKTVNRVLAVSDNVSAQLFCDIYVRNLCTRPMPLYSIPGLIDHH